MKCNTCGVEMPQGLKYCTNCGSALPGNQSAPNPNNYSSQNQFYNNYNRSPMGYPSVPSPAPMSVGGWIGRSFIPYIPFVGGLIFLIMLFVWSGDQEKDMSFRNWAKANLILTAIWFGIFLVIFLLLLMTGALAAIIKTTSTGSLS